MSQPARPYCFHLLYPSFRRLGCILPRVLCSFFSKLLHLILISTHYTHPSHNTPTMVRITPSTASSCISATTSRAARTTPSVKIRSFSSTPMRTPVRRHSSGSHAHSLRPSFLRPLSSLAGVALNPASSTSSNTTTPSTTKVRAAESVHLELAKNRRQHARGIATTNVNRIEQSHPVEAEGDMATTQDHVVIDVSMDIKSRRLLAEDTRFWSV